MNRRYSMLALALIFAAATSSVRPLSAQQPPVVSYKLGVVYYLDAKYSNTDTYGEEYCGLSGKETVSLVGIAAQGHVELRLASGAVGTVTASSDVGPSFEFQNRWTETGTQIPIPDSCAGNSSSLKPLACSGLVKTSGRPTVAAAVRGGTVVFVGDSGDLVEAGDCGAAPDSSLPYRGFESAISPWRVVTATIPLAELAARLPSLKTPADQIELPAKESEPAESLYSPTTCNHARMAGETCQGKLTVKATIFVRRLP